MADEKKSGGAEFAEDAEGRGRKFKINIFSALFCAVCGLFHYFLDVSLRTFLKSSGALRSFVRDETYLKFGGSVRKVRRENLKSLGGVG